LLNRGGTMSGGKVKNENTVFTAKSQITTLKQDLDSLNAKRELVNKDYSQLKDVYDSNQNKITELKISLASLESILSVKKDKYDKLKIEYDNLPDDEDQENADPEILDQQLISDLNEAYSHKDEVNAALINLRSLRNGLNPEIERNEAVLREARKQLDQEKDKSNRIKTDIALVDNNIRNELDRLVSVYHTTYEYALEHYKNADINETSKDEVRRLRMELDNYGTVNMEAEQQYAEVKERYDFLNHNYQDLVQSRDKILDAIDEMDKIMKKQFTDTFDAINKQLPDTFASLFGGGTAKLVLEDPNDVLNSGIDIDVKPPGKTIRSIRLFSGGEKTLIAISVLFTILKVKEVPIVIFDEVEAALDQANVERFAKYVRDYSDKTQFIIITHRPGTMAQCDSLYGVTMQRNGVSELMKVKLVDAIKMSDNNNEG
ncbi:MAG: AAA family ATPase, partial [Erysipelotrichaceae bacterium]|nr:AAA family ATPase [Erysipelotrichaceae bacterium]